MTRFLAIALVCTAACGRADALDPNADAADATACELGTGEHCGSCSTTCPGSDNAGTQRKCSSATESGMCAILCRGEFYDLDGDVMTGCEAEDRPVQDTTATALALSLPNVNNGTGSMPCNGATNPCTHVGQIYADGRMHDTSPTTRPNGREDWFAVTAIGAGGPNQVGACLGIVNFPTDNRYEVCIGNNGSTAPTTCQTAAGGGTSVCVTPQTAGDAGTFYVIVRKLAGANTTNGYALYLVH